jgi:preprotein translocase subunit SecB
MAEGNETAPQIRTSVLAQYIRDMSFENNVAQKGIPAGEVQPDIQIGVNMDARKRGAEHQYEVMTKYTVTSRNKPTGDVMFLMELDYAGVFHVEGVPEEQLHPYLMIECPRMLFPFARRLIADITREGGFPALNLETVDFVSLYRAEIARRQQAAATPTQ